jgi:hypothetical protein
LEAWSTKCNRPQLSSRKNRLRFLERGGKGGSTKRRKKEKREENLNRERIQKRDRINYG